MTNSALISKLFNLQDPIFIDFVFKKNCEKLINLGNYIMKRNLVFIPYEKLDFQSLILKSINSLKNITVDSINKFTYQIILKKIFVQHLINLNKKYSNNKEKILSTANNDIDLYQKFSTDNFLENKFNFNYDINNFYSFIIKKLKDNEKNIFKMYINNVKPAEISKITKIPIKKIYNTIFLIKNYCNNKVFNEYFH